MPKVSPTKFFRRQSIESRVKADIVSKFVGAWSKIVLNSQVKYGKKPKAAYVDLFSGPGSYEDGAESTPLLVIRASVANALARKGLQTFFNDESAPLVVSLEQEVGKVGVAQLEYAPVFTKEKASIALLQGYALGADTPQFYFLDQFGYANVTQEMIKFIFVARRCDCAFFFRISRVVAALNNPKSQGILATLFGGKRAAALVESCLLQRSVLKKEALIMEALEDSMKEAGASYFHAFSFRVYERHSAGHYLIYIGKNEKGLSIMKEIMVKASSRQNDGVGTMGFTQVEANPSLFEDPIGDLQNELLLRFDGQELTVDDIYIGHHAGTSYIRANYQEALRRLEAVDSVQTFPPAAERPKRVGRSTMAGDTKIVFRRKEPQA